MEYLPISLGKGAQVGPESVKRPHSLWDEKGCMYTAGGVYHMLRSKIPRDVKSLAFTCRAGTPVLVCPYSKTEG